MAKNRIVEKDGVRYVAIPLTKPYLIEGKIVGSRDSKVTLLVEEEGVIDTVGTDVDIADATAGDFDKIYDKASMRRMVGGRRMDADDFVDDDDSFEGGDYDDVMTPEEKFEMRRRVRYMRKMDKEDDKGEDKDKMDDKDADDKKEMRRRMLLSRMRRRMDKEDGEEKDKMDSEDKEEEKDKMRRAMRRRMDKEDDKKDEE